MAKNKAADTGLFKDFEKVGFGGKDYYALEPINEVVFGTTEEYASVFDEPGCELGIAHAVAADAEPHDCGFYPCVDLSYVRKDGGDWTKDGIERMAIADETGDVFALRWNPDGKNYEVAEAL